MKNDDFIIDYPRTYSDEAVREAFDMFAAEHPDIVEEWIRRETPRTEPTPDLKEISVAVQHFLSTHFSFTDTMALSSFWFDMRRIAYGISSARRAGK